MTLATRNPTDSASPTAAPPTAPAWTIDPAHTDILFSAKHMMVTTVRGKFHEVDGTLVSRRVRSDSLLGRDPDRGRESQHRQHAA